MLIEMTRTTQNNFKCVSCGHPKGDDATATQCRDCADKRNKRQAALNAETRRFRKLKTLCMECGDKRDNETVLCDACRISHNARTSRYRNRLVA